MQWSGTQWAGVSWLTNAIGAISKLLLGWLGHSSALMAEGIESFSDTISSLLLWQSLRIARQGADANHPYGHGKAEALATLATSVVMGLSALAILQHSLGQDWSDKATPAPWLSLFLGLTILIKLGLIGRLNKVAQREHSPGIQAEAAHHQADVLTSLAVLAGLLLSQLGGVWRWADPVLALLLSVWILGNAYRLARPAVLELMDTQVDGAPLERVRQAALAVPGVYDVEKLWLRRSGNEMLADIHLEVAPEMDVAQAHAIAHAVKDQLQALPPPRIGHVHTHIEPAQPSTIAYPLTHV